MSRPLTSREIQTWQPQKWSEVTGNSRLIRTWHRMIEQGPFNLLSTGHNGTGKTRIAKLGLKSLTCSERTGYDPCGKCHSCKLVNGNSRENAGVLAACAGSSYSFHIVDCERVSPSELDDLFDGGELSRENTIVYLDEVRALGRRGLAGRFLKPIDETPACWIATAISLRDKRDMRKGKAKLRKIQPTLSDELIARFGCKVGTSVPNPGDLPQWIRERCQDWELDIESPDATLPRVAERTRCVIRAVLAMLANAASRSDRRLTLEDVEGFDLDAID